MTEPRPITIEIAERLLSPFVPRHTIGDASHRLVELHWALARIVTAHDACSIQIVEADPLYRAIEAARPLLDASFADEPSARKETAR
jgi:hypothetical protein